MIKGELPPPEPLAGVRWRNKGGGREVNKWWHPLYPIFWASTLKLTFLTLLCTVANSHPNVLEATICFFLGEGGVKKYWYPTLLCSIPRSAFVYVCLAFEHNICGEWPGQVSCVPCRTPFLPLPAQQVCITCACVLLAPVMPTSWKVGMNACRYYYLNLYIR